MQVLWPLEDRPVSMPPGIEHTDRLQAEPQAL
jgi:hypothetical protein